MGFSAWPILFIDGNNFESGSQGPTFFSKNYLSKTHSVNFTGTSTYRIVLPRELKSS